MKVSKAWPRVTNSAELMLSICSICACSARAESSV